MSGLHSGGITRLFLARDDKLRAGQKKGVKMGKGKRWKKVKRQKGFFSNIDGGEKEPYKIKKKDRKVLPNWYLSSRKRCRVSRSNMISGFQRLFKSAKHCFRTIMQKKTCCIHGSAEPHNILPPLLRNTPILCIYSVWQKGDFSHSGTDRGRLASISTACRESCWNNARRSIPTGCSTASNQFSLTLYKM